MKQLVAQCWISLRVLFARLRGTVIRSTAKWKVRYDLWVERERSKNDRLRKKGDREWQEVKRLWLKHKKEREN